MRRSENIYSHPAEETAIRTRAARTRRPTVPLLLLGHIPLALLMFHDPSIATLHALVTVAIGLWWAVEGRLSRVMYMGAYIVGSEVLWRMTGAAVFWEFGKFALSAVFLVALVRRGHVKPPLLAVVYFVLLLPSIGLIADFLEWSLVRRQLSFNLSGPFALFVSAWFFRYVSLSLPRVRTLLLCLLAPILGIGANALFNTASVQNVTFGDASNYVTSGGFGPNQVSAVLGLGAVAAFLYLINSRRGEHFRRLLIFGIIIGLIFQSALTFSRSGLVLALISGVVAAFFLFRNQRARIATVVTGGLLFILLQFLVVPTLEGLTGGAFGERYSDLSSTGRTDIARMDLTIWSQHPVFGVGPGQAVPYRETLGRGAVAHTEFTRLLAEHGLLGLCALLALLAATGWNLARASSGRHRAFMAAMTAWGLSFMLVSGFRLAAPAYAIGLTFMSRWFDPRRGQIVQADGVQERTPSPDLHRA